MYIDSIVLRNFRSFRNARVEFVQPDTDFEHLELPTPRIKNLNLLLGDNGFGKTTLLKAIALACLGPSVEDVGIYPYRLVRREPKSSEVTKPLAASIRANFIPHPQDRMPTRVNRFESSLQISRKGDLEKIAWVHP